METFEMIAMGTALVLMFGDIGAKVAATQLIARMNHQVSHVSQARQEVLGRLKAAQKSKSRRRAQPATDLEQEGQNRKENVAAKKRIDRTQRQRRIAQAAQRHSQSRIKKPGQRVPVFL